MTEREMGMILATLDSHKEQLDRIEQTIAIGGERAEEKRDELTTEIAVVRAEVAETKVWQGRMAGATSLAVFVVPVAVAMFVR